MENTARGVLAIGQRNLLDHVVATLIEDGSTK